jgi:L-threonylcarbamoyladenylate synthase
MLPTDTVFGLAVLPTQTLGVDRLYALKARPRAKALPIMLANAGQLVDLGVIISLAIEKLLSSPFVPGALTIVAQVNPWKCPDWLHGRDEVAFRIPNSPLLLEVLAQVGPLLVTSANLAGAPTQQTVPDVLAQLTGVPDLVVPGEAGADIASTLINCSKNLAVIERVGAVSVADLSKWVAVCHG